ncbi:MULTISPECIES: deoxyguanosinetriphosphate triphosphohydrolase family protein [Microbacterium]|uniref:DNTP triphosphohydrolase n=1 Tax=Microbacterium wangchenii TaxID=2541726 RepID=A0ABX5SVK5_9MICO|nr:MULTISPECIES: dNTP triphosphohydrolase [Microbacterium]MCK6065420.1 dNTP triphosphohydrolase [Microbacterium sp. EYE_512]QBR88854.1 dNTP triphosphohydrolase [Microbacterium wangchenii]
MSERNFVEDGQTATEQGSTARVHPEHGRQVGDPFGLDLQRIQFSPYFSRLSAVTQVVSPSISGAPVHNRLTHTLKVSAIARAVARHLNERSGRSGGPEVCNETVVECAAHAHDLGHPPFGHLGESVLNRVAREELGLTDGFEGNAQTYRILTALDVTEHVPTGLNLTAAVRVATAKYPWTPAVNSEQLGERGVPRGMRRTAERGLHVFKYSAYEIDGADLEQARNHLGIAPFRQSVEGAVMDIADDIAYSVHDVDDFYRAGILNHAPIAAEFDGWLESAAQWRRRGDDDVRAETERGAAIERLRRKMRRDDPWVADDDAFHNAVSTVHEELVDDLLGRPFDGSLSAERQLATFTDRWIRALQASAAPTSADDPRSGPVRLSTTAWHHVEVLKFVHKHFVLSRPDLAIHQRGLSRVLTRSVDALTAWLEDEHDRRRVPRRLRELIELAREGYERRGRDEQSARTAAERNRMARARGILDYVASLTDAQAITFSETISGRGERLWSLGQSL